MDGYTDASGNRWPTLSAKGFGGKGKDGTLRVDGDFYGSRPERAAFFEGPRFREAGRPGPLMSNFGGDACRDVFLGSPWAPVPGDSPVDYDYVASVNGVESPVLAYRGEAGSRDASGPGGGAHADLCAAFPPLRRGLNVLSLKVRQRFAPPERMPAGGAFIELHPWERQYRFHFPGEGDAGGEGGGGLAESFAPGSSPAAPEPFRLLSTGPECIRRFRSGTDCWGDRGNGPVTLTRQ
jgi:hypothetical protein